MEKRYFFGRRKRRERDLVMMNLESVIEDQDESEREISGKMSVPEIPMESMEFLARSWSLSASEISKAVFFGNKKRNFVVDRLPEIVVPETLMLATSAVSGDDWTTIHKRTCRNQSTSTPNHQPTSGWFHRIDSHRKSKQKLKEKARAEQAQVHAAISVAGVAAAVAAIASSSDTKNDTTKMNAAMSLATELLASHSIEMAEHCGAHHEQVASAVESAVDMRSPGDLMTLTAAAATALRGAATLKRRMQREGRSESAVIPYEKTTCWSPDIWCKEGELLKRTSKGVLHRKKVSVYINNKSQVIVKLKSKLMGGAIVKKRKSVVYDIYDEIPSWPGRTSFGLKTARGLIEFQCENLSSKKKWVDGIRNLLRQVAVNESYNNCLGRSFESMKLG
ncbi:hypothetical protein LUZ60_016885 [Juncus effusus]|nr:hypothetical protein LUZ60_016885 [Juncus effusus]